MLRHCLTLYAVALLGCASKPPEAPAPSEARTAVDERRLTAETSEAVAFVEAESPMGDPARETPTKPLPRVTKSLLRSGLSNPIPGATLVGYLGDTGLDLSSHPKPVYALAAAKVEYPESGHTLWLGKHDSPYCIRLRLDVPILFRRRKITHVYYAHLSKLAFEQAETAKTSRSVVAGEYLGESGVARGLPHLHLGLLLDDQVAQDDWNYILREADVREVLGGYKHLSKLPKE